MSEKKDKITSAPAALEKCHSCKGVINPHNGECRCS